MSPYGIGPAWWKTGGEAQEAPVRRKHVPPVNDERGSGSSLRRSPLTCLSAIATSDKLAAASARREDLEQEIFGETTPRRDVTRRIYRLLGLTGYGRIDLRLTEAGEIYVLEANPNPQLARGEDFAESAKRVGIDYGALLQRIVSLGLRFEPGSAG